MNPCHWVRRQLGLPGAFVLRQVVESQTPHLAVEHHFGIRLVRFTDQVADDEYVDAVWQALQLLEIHHPTKLKRLLRHMKHILISRYARKNEAAGFVHGSNICTINLHWFRAQWSPAQRAIAIAALLVHEGTHGYLANIQTGYSTQARVRLESLCDREATRVLRSLSQRLKVPLDFLE